jgi:catechol 2,3-dioxygenase-like lactoylglutathione lyase family enzyme
MSDVRKPWTVSAMVDGVGLVIEKFASVHEALAWIPNVEFEGENLDPETQGYTHIAYEKPSEDFFAVENDYALVYGRIVCRIVDGWAGGAGNYKLQLTGQWGHGTPIEFWTPEGSTSDLGNDGVYGRNFPAPGASSDLILFSKEDL